MKVGGFTVTVLVQTVLGGGGGVVGGVDMLGIVQKMRCEVRAHQCGVFMFKTTTSRLELVLTRRERSVNTTRENVKVKERERWWDKDEAVCDVTHELGLVQALGMRTRASGRCEIPAGVSQIEPDFPQQAFARDVLCTPKRLRHTLIVPIPFLLFLLFPYLSYRSNIFLVVLIVYIFFLLFL